MFTPNALQELLHGAHLAIGIDVLTVRDTDADQWQIFGRAHGDAPNPITSSKEMMSREVRNEGAVLLLKRANTAQNFRIEIRQPEPENVLLLIDLLVKLQQLGENAVAPSRIDHPTRTQCVLLPRRILHGHSLQFPVLANIDSRHSAVDHFYPVLYVARAYLAIECKAVYLERKQRRHCGRFVDDVSTINAMVDVGLEV